MSGRGRYRTLRVSFFAAMAWGGTGCNGTAPAADADGSGGAIIVEGCLPEETPTLVIGKGDGEEFVPLNEGDPLEFEFGSQAGMEAPTGARTVGVLPSDVDRMLLELLVDGSPIGEVTDFGAGLLCDGEGAQVDAPVLIDVSDHPTVVSVAQLADREAQVTVTLWSDGEVFLSETVTVVITL